MAVCLGGHAAIVAAVNAMLFHPLRMPEPDRVLLMANQYPLVEPRRGTRSSTPDYGDRLRHVTVFEEQALYNFSGATVETGGVPTRMRGMVATPSLFRLLRVNPAHGRIFTDDEGEPGNETRVILTDGLWRELFGADPTVVGRTLRMSGRECTIVGVLPRGFSFGDPDARFWIPLALTARQRSDEARHRNGWFSIGRLKPGATIEQVRDQLKALDAANLERMPPRLQSIAGTTGFFTGVEPLQEALVRDVRGPLSLLWGAALAVLVIGVGNLATIALARSRARLNEMGTRLALGASRFDIVRQLLVEGLLIGAAGAAGALALAAWMLSAVRLALPGTAQLGIDGAAAGITFALGMLAGVLVGIVSASPLYTIKLGTMLHEGLRGGDAGPGGANHLENARRRTDDLLVHPPHGLGPALGQRPQSPGGGPRVQNRQRDQRGDEPVRPALRRGRRGARVHESIARGDPAASWSRRRGRHDDRSDDQQLARAGSSSPKGTFPGQANPS